VVEVEGLDRQGFLYDVTQVMFESGLSISSSIVATYGERAIDVFYVRDGFGHKIRHPDRLKSIETRLLQVLQDDALEGREALRA
jgi:[protein-PII] uridylyltransferase